MNRKLLSSVFGAIVLGAALAAAGAVSTTQPSIALRSQWIPLGFHAVRDVSYGAGGVRSQKLDLYVPNVRTAPRPLLIWIHGGAWMAGDKALPPGLGLLPRGFVVASINYRTTFEASFPAQIYDCKAAIRFLRAHAAQYDINPNRIGVWGDSAGGHLAALLGVTNGLKRYEGAEGNAAFPSTVQAVCDWFGPTDFLQSHDLIGAGSPAVTRLLGGMIPTELARARMASPAEQIGGGPLPPFLIMHGSLDLIVPLHQSQILFDRLKSAGDSVRLIVLPASGHGTGEFRDPRTMAEVYDFFMARLLRPTTALARLPATRTSLW